MNEYLRNDILIRARGALVLVLALIGFQNNGAAQVLYSTKSWDPTYSKFQLEAEVETGANGALEITWGIVQIKYATSFTAPPNGVYAVSESAAPSTAAGSLSGSIACDEPFTSVVVPVDGMLGGTLNAVGSTITATAPNIYYGTSAQLNYDYKNVRFTLYPVNPTKAGGTTPPASSQPPPAEPVTVPIVSGALFDNYNIDAVTQSSSPASPVFTLTADTLITEIQDYHYNKHNGDYPGEISLVSGGSVVGKWKAAGSASDRILNWVATPNVVLPAGTYTIEDSRPSTWSWNSQSSGTGFSRVYGEALPAEELWLDISDIEGVENGTPPWPTRFTTTASMFVWQIWNYHWNNGVGSTPGTISLKNSATGEILGPWKADGTPGTTPTSWIVQPNLVLPAGTWVVEDSKPSTWSWNQQSDKRGFVRIWVQ